MQNKEKKIKAWAVSDRSGECGTQIVYAETRGKAISLCLHDDAFDDCRYTDLYARRFRDYDQYYDGNVKPDLWSEDEHRIRLVRDYGWSCVDRIESYCNNCPAREWCE